MNEIWATFTAGIILGAVLMFVGLFAYAAFISYKDEKNKKEK